MVILIHFPYNMPPISPNDPGTINLVLTSSRNDQSEIAPIRSMTMVENRIPPLKKALPMNNTERSQANDVSNGAGFKVVNSEEATLTSCPDESFEKHQHCLGRTCCSLDSVAGRFSMSRKRSCELTLLGRSVGRRREQRGSLGCVRVYGSRQRILIVLIFVFFV